MVDDKHVSFAAVVALWTLVTLLITLANSHTPKVEIHRRHKLFHFGHFVKAKLFCPKGFVPVTRENYLPDLHHKRDLSNWASPAPHTNLSTFLRKKEWRGEILETEPAHMKRPLVRCL